jgi:hypothetical protein
LRILLVVRLRGFATRRDVVRPFVAIRAFLRRTLFNPMTTPRRLRVEVDLAFEGLRRLVVFFLKRSTLPFFAAVFRAVVLLLCFLCMISSPCIKKFTYEV